MEQSAFKSVNQKQSNNWHETHQAIFDVLGDCTGKLDHHNDHKMSRSLPVNTTVDTPPTSPCLSVDCIELEAA
jgi:hypothetical protein